MDIAGKVALVTGGANGIGKAMVDIMLQKQAKGIFILDISENALKDAQEELNKKYGEGKVHGCKCDVSSMEQMEACFKKAISTFGELHIVCNNAGIVNEITWQRMLEINVNGVIIGTKLAVKHLEGEKWGGGVIINTSSVAGLALVPFMDVYVASKCAVIGFTRQIAVVQKKIRVNVLCPAVVVTPMMLGNMVFADAKHQEIINSNLADKPLHPIIQPHEFAEQFVKLIEEPHHGQNMFVRDAQTHDFIKDEFKVFRERTDIEESCIKLRDAAV